MVSKKKAAKPHNEIKIRAQGSELTSEKFSHRDHQTDAKHRAAEADAQDRWDGAPALRRELEIAQRREDVREGTRARRADQLEHGAQITRQQADADGADDQR